MKDIKKRIENLRKLGMNDENIGWLLLSEESLARDWDNEHDTQWDKYL